MANLELHLLPLERVGDLGRRFDLIVCTGVLHHLPDPDGGLAALRAALKPGGAADLMVYAAYGRAGIYMLQEYARRLGLGHADEEIRDLAATLTAMPPGHPLARLLGASPDFRRKDALADALLNPLDRAYTVPELMDFLERGGLSFGRWRRQAPYSPRCGALAATPHGARLSALPRPEQHAAVELFRGTMLRHSLVARRDDDPHRDRIIWFEGGDGEWLSYVPIRAPDAVTVRERPPPGAAAALVNRGHADRDLVLPIDALELRLLEAVDGRRTVGEIARRAEAPASRARRLFEQLWLYDQVVFDASRASAAGERDPATPAAVTPATPPAARAARRRTRSAGRA